MEGVPLVVFLFGVTANNNWLSERSEAKPLSSCQLRFAVYVSIIYGIIVRAMRGQGSSHLPHQQFLKLLLSRLPASIGESWLAWPGYSPSS